MLASAKSASSVCVWGSVGVLLVCVISEWNAVLDDFLYLSVKLLILSIHRQIFDMEKSGRGTLGHQGEHLIIHPQCT